MDSNISARAIHGNRAFYLANSGIQWGRAYLSYYDDEVFLGPFEIGGGTIMVEISHLEIDYPNVFNRIDVYRIFSTALVGESERQVVEFRSREPGTDGDFLFWRETVSHQFE
ncbi:MAG: hypothetical protein HQ568_10515 [Calditrichaeota bacterium]|nr:hypothetical protein [Calditrichota bacterium]